MMKKTSSKKLTIAGALIFSAFAINNAWGEPQIVVLDPTNKTEGVETILKKIGDPEKRWEAKDIKYEGGQAKVIVPKEYLFNGVIRIGIFASAITNKHAYVRCKLPTKKITLEDDTVLDIFVKQDRSSCEVRIRK